MCSDVHPKCRSVFSFTDCKGATSRNIKSLYSAKEVLEMRLKNGENAFGGSTVQ